MPKTYLDPVTGDILSLGERISWIIQGVIRRWTFLILFTGVTALVWSTNNPTWLLWWNLTASYMAILIESVVGIALMQQTKRDAVVIRQVREINQKQTHMHERQLLLLEKLDRLLQHEEQELHHIEQALDEKRKEP